jgi:protoporphyrinogen/coproporphyrinogen III oxidase
MRVAVIGGGISGLCTAFRLRQAGVDVALFEGGNSVGGNIRTIIKDGFLIEHGPNSVLANREIWDLIQDLGISDQIAPPTPDAKKRFIVRGGKLVALPSGPIDILTTSAFSAGGRIRLLKEPFIRSRSSNGESVGDFFERRFGKEITEYAVDPFISGIYAGDPHKLSIKDAFPRLYKYEQDAGSIIKGALFLPKDKAAKVPKGSPRSFSFKDGMSTLPKALQERLGDSVSIGASVTSLTKRGGGYVIATDAADDQFESVVISIPAHAAARLVGDLDKTLAYELTNIYYPPIAVVYAAFRREQVRVEPNGFGVLVPAVENRRILGCLFSSSTFEGRTPEGFHLFTVFIGGSRNAELCRNTDENLIRIAVEEIGSLLGIAGGPAFTSIKKWERSIPQYNIGYESVPAAIDRFRESEPGIFFCSNFYRGISVGDCVKNSVATAKEVLEFAGR